MGANEFSVRVARKTREAVDINSYELVAMDERDLPAFEAGAHVDVHLPNGLVRQYSLCGMPHRRDRYRIAVLRDPKTRGGSEAIHDLVHEGDTLRISWPRNLFRLSDGPQTSILLAGGIGVTPLLAMAYHLHAQGRPFALHYFARSKERVAFLAELQSAAFASNIAFHLDDAAAAGKKPLCALLENMPRDAHIYTCGPTGFLNHVLETASALDWPAAQVHHETFSPPQAVTGDSFEVRILSTGQSVVVAQDETVVSAVARIGVEIPVSCEQGICGTCLTRVVEGVPDHHDQYLTDDEHEKNDQFTPCCSRSRTKVMVLDI
ncbi:PDR/VanB family oxidoreductase [Polaromonas jejuensis]|uniref:PDR/VanB family oxidoreductase n=1 Tax=Polaromonas jejuensis TaxID=457502 RepID=A0ABW0QH46_9BURK|nr:PDR/VanB family oxidoreductase [Polaromonas jejuensis]